MKLSRLSFVLLAVMMTVGGIRAAAQTWPNDPGAFDYGLAPGATKTANISADALGEWGVAKGDKLPTPSIVVDNITWLSGEKNGGQ